MKKRYFVWSIRDRFKTYENALTEIGHMPTRDLSQAGFCFYDIENERKWKVIKPPHRRNIPYFIYPHSPTSHVWWDSMYPAWPVVTNFVNAEGQKKVMETYGYPYPITVIGWTSSDILPFTPTSKVKTLLLAPMHPLLSRGYPKEEGEYNPVVLQKLLDLEKHYDKLIIRYGGDLASHNFGNLLHHPKVQLQAAQYTKASSIQSILDSNVDVIISTSTHGYTAVALGKPTLFFYEDLPIHEWNMYPKHQNEYKPFRRFPINFDGTWDSIMAASVYNEKVENWKKLFIGEPFDKKLFIDTVRKNIT